MKNEKEFKGIWWLPENPNDEIYGTVKFSNEDGTTLDLFGSFKSNKREYEIILGFTSNGKWITLYNSFDIQKGFSRPGFDSCKIFSNFMFIGKEHLEKKSTLKFHKSSVYLKNLDEWVNKRESFKIEQNWKEKEVTINYKLPESSKIELNDNLSLTINPTSKGPSHNIVQKEVKITQRIGCNLEYKRKQNFDKILQDISHFENFLTFCSQKPTYPLEFSVIIKKPKEKQNSVFEIYYQVTKPSKIQKDLSPFDFLVYFRNIEPKFEDVIKKWFFTKDILDTCYVPYFNNYYGKQLYTTDKFLNICRAIEAFHRDTVGEIDPTTSRPYYYKKRIIEIMNDCNSSFNFLLKIRDKDKFAIKIKDFRNDFTHSNPLLNNINKKYLETHYLTEKLTIILTCAILKYLDFTNKEIKIMIENTSLYNRLKYKRKK